MAASLKPFSIAGMKFDGIAWPTSMFSNSNLVGDPAGSGSIYLRHYWIQYMSLRNRRGILEDVTSQLASAKMNGKINTW